MKEKKLHRTRLESWESMGRTPEEYRKTFGPKMLFPWDDEININDLGYIESDVFLYIFTRGHLPF
jgi:hypothetical protein